MSGFLLDTNVISELVKPRPEPAVAHWVESVDQEILYLSVLTLGEIRKGIASLRSTTRRASLEAWLDADLVLRFAGRILVIDQDVADRWGQLSAAAVIAKKQLPVIDGLLAATAIQYNLTLVTRNTKDLIATGIPLYNPWLAP